MMGLASCWAEPLFVLHVDVWAPRPLSSGPAGGWVKQAEFLLGAIKFIMMCRWCVHATDAAKSRLPPPPQSDSPDRDLQLLSF